MHQVWERTGRKPRELSERPECPPELAYLWEWLLQIPKPITFTEIHHWSQVTRRNVRAWEAELLVSLPRLLS